MNRSEDSIRPKAAQAFHQRDHTTPKPTSKLSGQNSISEGVETLSTRNPSDPVVSETKQMELALHTVTEHRCA